MDAAKEALRLALIEIVNGAAAAGVDPAGIIDALVSAAGGAALDTRAEHPSRTVEYMAGRAARLTADLAHARARDAAARQWGRAPAEPECPVCGGTGVLRTGLCACVSAP